MTPDWYARSLKRMERAALIIAAAGLVATLIYAGWRSALGFLIGAIIAHFNFGLWKRITAAVGGEEGSGDGKAVILGIRYLLIAGAVFVIIKLLDVGVLAVMAGLLVSVAAVLVELVRQLVRPSET
jgi:hypothetical protein